MSLKKRIHSIESELCKSEVWDDSSEWLWIRKSDNNHKGFIGERITDLWAEYANVLVEPRVSPEHDRIINYLKHEIKLGTLTNDLKFKFGHIKMSYDWNILTLIGVWPHDIKMWQVPKANVEELFYSGHMIPYKKGREDDILTFDAHKIPDSIAMHEIFLPINQIVDQEGIDLFHEHWRLPSTNHQAPMIIPFDLTLNHKCA